LATVLTDLDRPDSPSIPETRDGGGRRLLRIGVFLPLGLLIVVVFVALALAPKLFAHYDPNAIYVGSQFNPPDGKFWLGTDEVGRDLYSRVVYGTRVSLGMATIVVVVGAALGILVGAASGFVGGFADEVIMRVVELFLSLPAFILALAIAAVLGRGETSVVVALSIVWWPGYARLVRGMVMKVKHRLHVEGARSLGASSPYIVWRHILPFTWGQLNARITQDMGYALVNVAGLSFLGLGAQAPTPEWGALLNSGRTYTLNAWWYALFPGLAITIWTLGVSMLGDAISERSRSTTDLGRA
jgi:peptide/nickel transport system permease protein